MRGPGVVALREKIERLLSSEVDGRRLPPLLIQGDTNGLLARVHRTNARARGAFVDVNWAAIPDALLEVELLGSQRDVITDARQATQNSFGRRIEGTPSL